MADKKGKEQVVLRILDGEGEVDASKDLAEASLASPSHEIARMSPLKPPKMDFPAKITTVTGAKEALQLAAITPKTPSIGSSTGSDKEDDENVHRTPELKVKGRSWTVLIEWVAFLCITGCVIASLTIDKLLTKEIWGLGLWKWCVLVLVIFYGCLLSQWFINRLVFLIERNSLLEKKVLYYVYELRKSVIIIIWLALVLLAWGVLFDQSSKRSKKGNKILNYVTPALVASLIGAGLWLVKTLLVTMLSDFFTCARFFNLIQEELFHEYVLHTLSAPPPEGRASTWQLRVKISKKKDGQNKWEDEVINVDILRGMKQENITPLTMGGLIDYVTSSGLSTSNTKVNFKEEEGEQKDKEINSSCEPMDKACQIFKSIAKPGSKYIDEEDLLRFMSKEEIDYVLPFFEGGVESRKIKRKTLKNWLMNAYVRRKSVAHSVNGNMTAMEKLNKLASAIALIVIIIEWLCLMGFLTKQVLVLILSQLALMTFMFGNTGKTVFEGIIFIFAIHPFDVGDCCVVDGVQMVVEEMKFLTTIFSRNDREKVFYPNSVLATKPISNFYKNAEVRDLIEFSVDFSTSTDNIAALETRIKTYLENKPQFWRPNLNLVVKEIENVNKMKLDLYVNHTINFKNSVDKFKRRSNLILEVKKIFENLDIKYHLLTQEVQANSVGLAAAAPTIPPCRR